MAEFYDDFLRLSQVSFQNTRLAVFAGVSGSGKSTAIQFLCREHPDLAGTRVTTFQRTAAGLSAARVSGRTVVLDEVNSTRELPLVARLVRSNRVLVASHLPLACFLPFHAFYPTKRFRTDRGHAKIARYLRRQRIAFTEPAIRHYCRSYGANFLDLRHILERHPSDNFDHSYARFRRLCELQRAPWTA